MNIYVGNLSYSLTEEQLRDLFVEFGEVSSVRVMTDRESGRPKGFGFVEMPNSSQANDAIEALNGKEVMGRKMTVNEARPREDRPKNRDRRPRN
ncbi:MAG: RNA-binding protein [Planctomycetes bacterium]|jgi:RNA recognition motif-containing protein|nr:RNA-binding protein [Planctomycetota bacterium]HNZ66069.1 RNA-binding protein [Planctomycetota bacterium]HON44002.1 RNA-binding protein [Planctomycetota bacterium]HPY74721.1 RNA-binding protein [Planctomycetota bacterium]HQA99728.1 RNA-binding protein [Planctomycetota bacterium]